MNTDRVFADPLDTIVKFNFDERVAAVFPDMIERSVPGYSGIVAQTGLLAARFAASGTLCYDLGCSLGASSFSMAAQLAGRDCRIVAVDNSAPMLARLQCDIASEQPATPIQPLQQDICKLQLQPCSVAVLNFTLQFIATDERAALIRRLAQYLTPGGALILSEKIAFDDPVQQQLHTEMYENFKRANGYSELEISQKREALENVLIPETLGRHRARLLDCGFRSVEVWFQCFNFVSLVAIR